MVSEPHLIGSEFGELQYAIWKTQFEALRDGDSNFYLWSKSLRQTMRKLRGIAVDYKQTLADVIVNNSDVEASEIQQNVFLAGSGHGN